MKSREFMVFEFLKWAYDKKYSAISVMRIVRLQYEKRFLDLFELAVTKRDNLSIVVEP